MGVGMHCWNSSVSEYMPEPTNIVELKTALSPIWNDLPQEFIDIVIASFHNRV